MFSHLTQVAVTEERSGMITRPRRPQERNPGCLIFSLSDYARRPAAPNQRLAHGEVGTKPVFRGHEATSEAENQKSVSNF